MNKSKVTIIGAGHGGQTIAGVYASLGYDTWIYNHTSPARRIEKINEKNNTITLEVLPHCNTHGRIKAGTFKLGGATYNLKKALSNARIIHISTSDLSFTPIATAIAPHLRGNEHIFLHSCGLGAALTFRKTLTDHKCTTHNLTISEITALPYSTRVKSRNKESDDGQVEVNLVKKTDYLGTLPFDKTATTVQLIKDFFPFTPSTNPLQPALNNLGHVFHLPVMLYNSKKWLGTTPWRFYADGYANKHAQKLVTEFENERQLIADTLGVPIQTASDFLKESYGVEQQSNSLGETLQEFGYYGRLGPHAQSITKAISIEHGLRQLTEEYYCKLAPLVELTRSLKIKTPAMKKAMLLGKKLGLQPERYARTSTDMGVSPKNLLEELYTAYNFRHD